MRVLNSDIVVDTCLFSPLQLQPRALFALSFSGLAGWFHANVCSFPALLGDHHFGMVFLNLQLKYEQPLGFFDADVIQRSVTVRLLRDGSRVELVCRYSGRGRNAGTGRSAAVLTALLCPVLIEEAASLAARPEPFSPAIQAHFHDSERGAAPSSRVLPGLVKQLEGRGTLLASGEHDFMIHRHMAEVADQWSFAEIPGIVESGREKLVLNQVASHSELAAGLSKPLRCLDVELSRPYFTFDHGKVTTQAYALEQELGLVHRLSSTLPGLRQHGVVVERY